MRLRKLQRALVDAKTSRGSLRAHNPFLSPQFFSQHFLYGKRIFHCPTRMSKEAGSERARSETRFEVKLTPDGTRLLLVTWHVKGRNFWVHDDGTFSWVPTENDIKTIHKAYEAIDGYNQRIMLKKNLRFSSETRGNTSTQNF